MSQKAATELYKLRHTAEHILHQAVKELYPSIQLAMGPATDEGFYFDFDGNVEGEKPVKITTDDFTKIEKRMQEIISRNLPLTEKVISEDEARKLFADNPYKQEWIDQAVKKGEKITIYWTGESGEKGSMVDLCRGPHVANTGEVKAFKLLSVAGAYWHGDEKNKMLTRIYGTAFGTQQELDRYLEMRELAKERDHRKLGRDLSLFFTSPSVGPGYPMYLPQGWLIRQELEQWIISEKQKRGYQFVWTPHVGKSDLYRQSGHWQKYDAMMSPMQLDEHEYVVKPMSCPHHFQIYKESQHSYRDLPYRIAENATVYRYEKAGEINGLLRVRALTQDDAHTFVTHEGIAAEIDQVINFTQEVYRTFGFSDYQARISVRDPATPDKYMGDRKSWDQAEQALEEAAKRHNLPYYIGQGEAAFYGPKIDIVVKDALGRDWQLTTIQLDFVQPENFDMTYTDEQGGKKRPAILHIAILGALDRFLGILIEHYGGAFPLWLAPTQVRVATISDQFADYGKSVVDKLKEEGLRAELDDSNLTLGKKSALARSQKLPYLAIIGAKEKENKTITLKDRAGKQQVLTIDELIASLKLEISSKL